MKYRPDIQILRGIAVLAVLLFHINPKTFPGGFVGVDIFFVISGFLMNALYIKKIGSQHTAREFFIRRFNRIIPAYYLTIALSFFMGAILFVPYEFNLLIQQGLAGFGLVPNIFLWSGESYFDEFTFRPLLHLWSLGVELQFYLFVPLAHVIIKRSKTAHLLILLFSFFTCLIVVQLSPKTAFFFLPFRVWEFYIGFTVAHYCSFRGNDNLNDNKYSWLGAVAVIVIILQIFIEAEVRSHPGIFALVSCLLSGVLLTTNLPIIVLKNPFSKLLEYIGKYSYSLYLVHFPILVFTYHTPFSGDRITTELDFRFLITLTSILFATLALYHGIEKRKWHMSYKWNSLYQYQSLLVFIVLAFTFSFFISSISFDQYEKSVTNAPFHRSFWRCGKFYKLLSLLNSEVKTCQLNKEVNRKIPGALLVGDSHADAIKMALAKIATKHKIPLHFMIESCNLGNGDCSFESLLGIIKQKNINTVILHDIYSNYSSSQLKNFIPLAKRENVYLCYIDPIPVYPQSIPLYLYNAHNGVRNDPRFEKQKSDFLEQYKEILLDLDKFKIHHLPSLDFLCTPKCQLGNGEISYYSDSHHLTLEGSELLEPMFELNLFQ